MLDLCRAHVVLQSKANLSWCPSSSLTFDGKLAKQSQIGGGCNRAGDENCKAKPICSLVELGHPPRSRDTTSVWG
jgi:hypothetical protein